MRRLPTRTQMTGLGASGASRADPVQPRTVVLAGQPSRRSVPGETQTVDCCGTKWRWASGMLAVLNAIDRQVPCAADTSTTRPGISCPASPVSERRGAVQAATLPLAAVDVAGGNRGILSSGASFSS